MKTLLVVIMGMAIGVRAQEAEQASGEEASPPSSAYLDVPAMLAGRAARHNPLGEQNPQNSIIGVVAVSQGFTDNAQLTYSDRKMSDSSFEIEPQIAFNHSTTRLSCDIGVMGGFNVDRTLQDRNKATQAATLDFSYRLARFTTIRLSDGFANTTGLWSGAGPGVGSASAAGLGVVEAPNNALFTYGEIRSNTAFAEVSHQFTANGTGGLRATETIMWFPNSSISSVIGMLYGEKAYSTEAFYNHRLSSRHWVGVTVRGQRFDFDHAASRTDTVSSLFLYGFNIRPNISISLFAGPEFSTTSTPQGIATPMTPFRHRLWSPATGAVFSWQGQRTGTSVSYSRQVNNGSGLGSAVTLNSADAALQRRWTRSLGAEAGVGYAQNQPILTNQPIRIYSARLQFTFNITKNVALYAGYARDEHGLVGRRETASANRAWISFSYSFLKRLGQ